MQVSFLLPRPHPASLLLPTNMFCGFSHKCLFADFTSSTRIGIELALCGSMCPADILDVWQITKVFKHDDQFLSKMTICIQQSCSLHIRGKVEYAWLPWSSLFLLLSSGPVSVKWETSKRSINRAGGCFYSTALSATCLTTLQTVVGGNLTSLPLDYPNIIVHIQ